MWAVPVSLIVLVGAFGGGVWASTQPAVQAILANVRTPLPPFGEAWTLTQQQFYGPLPPPDVRMRGAIRGVLETLDDPYTVLLDPPAAQQEQRQLAGRYGDVGVALWWTVDGGIGLSPFPDGPAAIAGVREGDRLLSVDGVPVTGTLNLDDVSRQFYGEVGTTVTLELLRPPTPALTVTVERDEVLHPSVRWRWIDAGKGIGYLRIAIFTDQTATEVRDLLSEAVRHPLNALVVDVRSNGGGVVAPLPAIAGVFLERGSTLYYEVERRNEAAVRAKGEMLFAGPLAIVVDGGTASAAEIFAAALHENNRAVLVGQPTFGKGSIQRLYPLSDGSTLHITSAVWLTPERHRLDGEGLQPDLLIVPVEGQDAALSAALAYLFDPANKQ